MLALVNAHHQDVDPLGAFPVRQWVLLRVPTDVVGCIGFYEVGQHVRGDDELPHPVKNDNPARPEIVRKTTMRQTVKSR